MAKHGVFMWTCGGRQVSSRTWIDELMGLHGSLLTLLSQLSVSQSVKSTKSKKIVRHCLGVFIYLFLYLQCDWSATAVIWLLVVLRSNSKLREITCTLLHFRGFFPDKVLPKCVCVCVWMNDERYAWLCMLQWKKNSCFHGLGIRTNIITHQFWQHL